MTINKYKSRTHETKLYSNILFWQSCIYRRWTQTLLSSQHIWASSAALFWWSSWPCPPSPVSAVHHVPHCCCQTESDHGWERGIEAIIAWVHEEDEEDHDDAPEPHNLQEQENTCGTSCRSVCSKHLCACSPWEQLPVKHLPLMLSAFHFLPNCISHVYNYMLIFDIASLLLWCSEPVSRRLLVRSPQSSPPVSLLQVAEGGLGSL